MQPITKTIKTIMHYYETCDLSPARGAWVVRLALVILCFAILGVPVNALWQLPVLLCVGLVVVFAPLRAKPAPRVMMIIASALLVAVLCAVWPQPVIHEGHQIIVIKPDNAGPYKNLPKPVADYIYTEFEKNYPREKRCKTTDGGCWQLSNPPEKLYAFSGDGFWQKPLYSRDVSRIDFHNLYSLRGAFINDIAYNWYEPGSEIDRTMAPYFVRFDLPAASLAGAKLCWQGAVFWPDAKGTMALQNNTTQQCRALDSNAEFQTVYGVQIGNDKTTQLVMQLVLSPMGQIMAYGLLALKIISVLWLLHALFIWRDKKLMVAGSVLALGLVIIALLMPRFYGLLILNGGNDGLGYQSFAYHMLQDLARGDWLAALRGGEAIYYYMPGMRYFRVLETLLFGDRHVAALIATIIMPFFFFYLFRNLFNTTIAWRVMAVFIFALPLARLGFWYETYIEYGFWGFGEPIGYGLFVTALALLLHPQRHQHKMLWATAGICAAIAVFFRPNLILAFGVLAMAVGILWLQKKIRLRQMVYYAAGASIVFLMAVHNYVYGNQIVLLTSAGTHEANLLTAPAVYKDAVYAVFSGVFDHPALHQVITHLGQWLALPARDAMQPALDFSLSRYVGSVLRPLCFALVILRIMQDIKHWRVHPITITAWTALALHVPIWFTHTDGRYVMLAWLLSSLVAIDYVIRLLKTKQNPAQYTLPPYSA